MVNHILISGEHKTNVGIKILLRGFTTLKHAGLLNGYTETHYLATTTRHEE